MEAERSIFRDNHKSDAVAPEQIQQLFAAVKQFFTILPRPNIVGIEGFSQYQEVPLWIKGTHVKHEITWHASVKQNNSGVVRFHKVGSHIFVAGYVRPLPTPSGQPHA